MAIECTMCFVPYVVEPTSSIYLLILNFLFVSLAFWGYLWLSGAVNQNVVADLPCRRAPPPPYRVLYYLRVGGYRRKCVWLHFSPAQDGLWQLSNEHAPPGQDGPLGQLL